LIAAVARNGVIGACGALPWRLPDDLKHFRALTLGHAVIMGRKTWTSLTGALPQRQNIVVTRDPMYKAAGAQVAATLPAALAAVELPRPAFCIGGGELYAAALPFADLLYLTELERDFAGDAFFPPWPRSEWRVVSRDERCTEDGLAYAFVCYARVRPS
jgi:dihydrofolate reductase